MPQMFDVILFIMKLLSLSSIGYLALKLIHVYITRYFWHVHFTNSYVIIKLQLRPIIILHKSVNNHENTEICTLLKEIVITTKKILNFIRPLRKLPYEICIKYNNKAQNCPFFQFTAQKMKFSIKDF